MTMNNHFLLLKKITILCCCLLFAGCSSESGKITAETLGKNETDIKVSLSTNAVDTTSRQFKEFKKTIDDYISANGTFNDYSYAKVSAAETGLRIELSDERYDLALMRIAEYGSEELYDAWATMLNGCMSLSKTISETGYEILKKNCDCEVIFLNSQNKELVLAYIINGKTIFDVLEDIGAHGDLSDSSNYGDDKYNQTQTEQSSGNSAERNAVDIAKQYLNAMSFSYTSLIEQLEYEGYSHSEAVYGADHCGADWYEQAVKSASSYLGTFDLSRRELIDQLEYERFTREEAEYAASKYFK